jgi:lactobin A/cerein 7B family class IIb bacteriocin
MTLSSQNELISELIQKSWTDISFKENFIKEPLQVIKKHSDQNIDTSKKIKIIVNDQTDPEVIFFNIPRKLKIEDLELSDKDLEKVSGGWNPVGLLLVGALIYGVTYGAGFAAGYIMSK